MCDSGNDYQSGKKFYYANQGMRSDCTVHAINAFLGFSYIMTNDRSGGNYCLWNLLVNPILKLNNSVIVEALWKNPEESVAELIENMGLKQISDSSEVEGLVDQVLDRNANMVDEFKSGKEKAFNALVGQVMKASKGKANPSQVNEILKKKLSN